MKKKLARLHLPSARADGGQARRHHRSVSRTRRAQPQYLVVVRSWMFLVAFAMMLGLGAMVGNFLNVQFNQSTPQVAGASIEK